jgi:hypothetical protein
MTERGRGVKDKKGQGLCPWTPLGRNVYVAPPRPPAI